MTSISNQKVSDIFYDNLSQHRLQPAASTPFYIQFMKDNDWGFSTDCLYEVPQNFLMWLIKCYTKAVFVYSLLNITQEEAFLLKCTRGGPVWVSRFSVFISSASFLQIIQQKH